jgi:transglutaminase-like putative cysteine protease
MIYRDSCDRVADAARQLGLAWNSGAPRTFAEKALAFVQGFQYERNLDSSDFVNLVSAVTEGRGDCDSRAMLFAILLSQANIPAAMMVSRDYSHAMGLADIPGAGARFEAGGTKWLVAETTSRVAIGLINQEVSNLKSWLAVLFD